MQQSKDRQTEKERKKKKVYVLVFLDVPSADGPLSGVFRFLSCSSSREKPGPVCAAGVGKASGLGNMLESGPDRPNPHSGKKLDGDGRRASDTKRLGRAEMGVSMLLLLVYALLFCVVAVAGGGGRANGLGGPCAPALRMAPADGDGGGKTTPGWLGSRFALAGVRVLFPAESREESSAVALPPSEFSLGICTFNWGRFDCPLFVRVGGIISLDRDDIDCVRVASFTPRGGGGGGIDGGFSSPWGS